MVIWDGLGPVGVMVFVLAAKGPNVHKLPQQVAWWATMTCLATAGLSFPAIWRGQDTAILEGIVNLIAVSSAWDSVIWRREHQAISLRAYYWWWSLFWLSLNVIAWSPNLAVSWLAIEFSTLASGALIVLGNTPQALEAAWKYIVIASVGLALGLMGIIFIYGSLRSQGLGWQTLSYVNLWRHHAHIAEIIRAVATLLVVGGIGTKVGLVPFHTWLPDAHSEAPSPVSGLLSGVLLGLCLITLVRFIQAVPVPSESVLSGPHLLLGFGMASVAMGALALFVQHDIKRLLAYSSIEQMGIMAIGFGLGTPLAETAALWQYAFHAVIKSTLFFTSGHLTERYHSKNLGHITDLARQHPKMAGLWAVGILALAGLPPLGLAYSEWMILWALWQSHALWALVTMSTALVLTFTALLYHLLKGLWGGLESWPQLKANTPGGKTLAETSAEM
ncbi:MAG: hypothetical protein C7B44_00775 [Sulfobacillus thermosulfidooxidans]|nr:MAG: hypothetical protein C7B44_00775 [Sulfobacillus thermosulfidooxidans]